MNGQINYIEAVKSNRSMWDSVPITHLQSDFASAPLPPPTWPLFGSYLNEKQSSSEIKMTAKGCEWVPCSNIQNSGYQIVARREIASYHSFRSLPEQVIGKAWIPISTIPLNRLDITMHCEWAEHEQQYST